MRYHVKERAWTWTEEFEIYDDGQNPIYDVRGRLFSGDHLWLTASATGEELVQVIPDFHFFGPASYQIYWKEQLWATVEEEFSWFSEAFSVETADGMIYQIEGEFWSSDFSITDGYGNILAEVSKELSWFEDCYALDVAEDALAAFIVALVLVVDTVRERKKK